VIEWTPEKLKRFKTAFSQAQEIEKKTGEDEFEFDGFEFVLGYAKYLIEYLDQRFGKVH